MDSSIGVINLQRTIAVVVMFDPDLRRVDPKQVVQQRTKVARDTPCSGTTGVDKGCKVSIAAHRLWPK